MPPLRPRRAAALAALLTAAGALALLSLPLTPAVTVTDVRRNRRVLLLPVTEFAVSFTHSVNKGLVRDEYRADGLNLVLTDTHFAAYGAGMPDPEAGQTFRSGADGPEIAGLNRVVPRLYLQTGLYADHHLHFADADLALNDIVPRQTRLLLRSERVSAFTRLAGILSHLRYAKTEQNRSRCPWITPHPSTASKSTN